MSTNVTSNLYAVRCPPWPDLAAIATMAVGVSCGMPLVEFPLPPRAILMVLCLAGFVAGLPGTVIAGYLGYPPFEVARIGARGSLLAALVGASLAVIICYLRWGSFRGGLSLTFALPSILPAALCGTLAATVIAMYALNSSGCGNFVASYSRWTMVAAVAFTMAGFALPFLPINIPRLGARTLTKQYAPIPRDAGSAVQHFVAMHHRKLTQGDVAGMVADYADSVDYLGRGLVTRDAILNAELQSHGQYNFIEQTVTGLILVSWLPNGNCEVTYPLIQKARRRGEFMVRQMGFQIVLEVANGPSGFQIVRNTYREEP